MFQLEDVLSAVKVWIHQFGLEFFTLLNLVAFVEIGFLKKIVWSEQITSFLVRCLKLILNLIRFTFIVWLTKQILPGNHVKIAPSLYSWAAVIVFGDFLYYFFHRVSHNVRLFWAQHSVHHTFTQMCFLNGKRNQVFNILWTLPTTLILLLVGFSLPMIVFQRMISSFFQFSAHFHKPIRYPFPFNYIFVSPAQHHIHHQVSPHGKNLGAIFIFWDRLLGTYSEDNTNPEMGLSYHCNPQGLLTVVLNENIIMIKDVLIAQGLRARLAAFMRMKPFGESEKGAENISRTI